MISSLKLKSLETELWSVPRLKLKHEIIKKPKNLDKIKIAIFTGSN